MKRIQLPKGYELIPMPEEFESEAQWNPLFLSAINNRMSPSFYNWIDTRLHVQTANAIFSITGLQGTGKSYAAVWLAVEKLGNFDLSHLTFDLTELLHKLKTAKRGDTFIYDEQKMEFGPGARRQKADIQAIEEACRQYQLNLIFCAPSVKTHAHQYVIECWGRNYALKRTYSIVYSQKMTPMGYIETGYPPEDLMVGYNKLKEAYIRKVLDQKGTERYSEWQAMIDSLRKSPLYDVDLKPKEKRALLFRTCKKNITATEAELIIAYLKVIERSEEEKSDAKTRKRK